MARKSNNTEFNGEYEIADQKIMTMEEEKRERLIMEALKEFSKGYAYANMDEIVKRAGISKGLLFHYFGTKKGVFLFLLKYTLNIVNTKFEEIVLEKNDFLQNIWQASKMELDLSFEQPYVMDFLVKAAFCKRQVLFPKKWHLFFLKCGKLFSRVCGILFSRTNCCLILNRHQAASVFSYHFPFPSLDRCLMFRADKSKDSKPDRIEALGPFLLCACQGDFREIPRYGFRE